MVQKITTADLLIQTSLSCSPYFTKGARDLVLSSNFDLDLRYTSEVSIDFNEFGITWEPNKTYTIEIPAGFFKDKEGDQLDCVSQTITFTTTGNPQVSSIVPASNTTGYNSPIVTLKFDHVVMAASGNIKLYNFSTSELISTINIADTSKVSFRTGNCVINLRGLISNSTSYYLTIDSGAIKNLDGFLFSGITDNTTIKFQVGDNNILGPVSQDLSYSRGGSFSLTGAPLITDTYSTTADYTLTIQPVGDGIISNITAKLPQYYNESQFIENPNPDIQDLWGSAMAISGDNEILIVGSEADNNLPSTNGAIYIFQKLFGVSYNYVQKIDGLLGPDGFGQTVSLSNSGSVFTCDSAEDPSIGSLRIYKNSGSNWTELQKINISRGCKSIISGDGNTIATIQYGDTSNKPSVIIRKYNGTSYTIEATLSPSGVVNNEILSHGRYTISDDGNLLIISSKNHNTNGAVFIFRRSGTTWVEEQKITSPSGSGFGTNVFLFGTSKLTISGPFHSWIYSYSSSWNLEETVLNKIIIAVDQTFEKFLISTGGTYNFRVMQKAGGSWVTGKQPVSTINSSVTIPTNISIVSKDMQILVFPYTEYDTPVQDSGCVSILELTEYGGVFDPQLEKLTMTLPSPMINSILSSTEIQMKSDDPSLNNQAFIQDFEIKYTVTTPDSRTDYKTQVVKFY